MCYYYLLWFPGSKKVEILLYRSASLDFISTSTAVQVVKIVNTRLHEEVEILFHKEKFMLMLSEGWSVKNGEVIGTLVTYVACCWHFLTIFPCKRGPKGRRWYPYLWHCRLWVYNLDVFRQDLICVVSIRSPFIMSLNNYGIMHSFNLTSSKVIFIFIYSQQKWVSENWFLSLRSFRRVRVIYTIATPCKIDGDVGLRCVHHNRVFDTTVRCHPVLVGHRRYG